ncbi:MAG: hypothetical protein PHN75_10970 [Syntrophales bacterium]|nr:hypothetical protein [Syntrophales bacterium]
MKTSSTWNLRSIIGKMAMGLVLAAMIGSIDVTPALSKNDHKDMGRHDNGRFEHRGPGYDHNRYEGRRGDYRPYGYGGRVYAPPPPVIYAPPPPPGIGIFFPPIVIHP